MYVNKKIKFTNSIWINSYLLMLNKMWILSTFLIRYWISCFVKKNNNLLYYKCSETKVYKQKTSDEQVLRIRLIKKKSQRILSFALKLLLLYKYIYILFLIFMFLRLVIWLVDGIFYLWLRLTGLSWQQSRLKTVFIFFLQESTLLN